MAQIKCDAETHALAKRLAKLTGKSLNVTVKHAVQARLDQVEKSLGMSRRVDELDRIVLACAKLPRRDQRSADEIIGYDNWGVVGT